MAICESRELMAFLLEPEVVWDVNPHLAHFQGEYCGRCSWVLGAVRKAAGQAKDVDALTQRLRELNIALPSAPPVSVKEVARRAGEVLAARVNCRIVGSFLFGGAGAHYFSDVDLLPHLGSCDACRNLLTRLTAHGEQVEELLASLQQVGQYVQFDLKGFATALERARQIGHLVLLTEGVEALRQRGS